MLRLLGWSVPAADHGVLEKFSHRDASFPAKPKRALIPLKGPAVARLLMAEEFRNPIVIKEGFQHDLRGGSFRDQQRAVDFFKIRRKVPQTFRHKSPLVRRGLVGSPVVRLVDIEGEGFFSCGTTPRSLGQWGMIVEAQIPL
jgi:hypothetical protein